MNKRNISNYLSLAVNIKINVIFWFMIYEINKTQSYKPKRKQLLIAICGFIKQMKDES